MMKLICLLFFSALCLTAWTRTAEEWKSRTLYQIVTDRFGRLDENVPECPDLFDYCGGTFKGIEKNLDYIQGMGFNAIWISPIIANTPKGYHGYWVSNLYEINTNFGTKQDFKDLVNACHERDIWVMVDVVPNHVSPVPNDTDFSGIYPFNDIKYYHDSSLQCADVFKNDPNNQTAMELCWLWNLPDLNHEDEFVSKTLIDWIRDFIQEYQVDGLRGDAVRHTPQWFWHEFGKAAGVFLIGEVWAPGTEYVATYQETIDSLLNFPLYEILEATFRNGGSMTAISKYYDVAKTAWKDQTVLGNFVDSHDLQRFLHHTPNMNIFKSWYAYVLSCVGIPSVYYGDEQSFTGGTDPANREPLWGKMNPESEMYQFFKTLITFRYQTRFFEHEQIERLADDTFYAFSRGDYFFAFTNSPDTEVRTIINHPYTRDVLLCDLINPKDCTELRDGEFEITLGAHQFKILSPQEIPESDRIATKAWKNIKKLWNNVVSYDYTKLYSRPGNNK